MTYAEPVAATNYSFLRGASHPAEMVTRAAALGMNGIGIADRNTVAGVVLSDLGRRPRVSDRVNLGPVELEVLEVLGNRIVTLRLTVPAEEPPADDLVR